MVAAYLESILCMKESTVSDVYTLMKAFNTIKLTYNIWNKLNLSEKIAYDYAQGTNDVLLGQTLKQWRSRLVSCSALSIVMTS